LFQELSESDADAFVADTNADRAVLVMDGNGDDGPVKARVGHAGHRQEQASGKEWRVVHAGIEDAPECSARQALRP
jgi:hypothetical protein